MGLHLQRRAPIGSDGHVMCASATEVKTWDVWSARAPAKGRSVTAWWWNVCCTAQVRGCSGMSRLLHMSHVEPA